MNRNVINRYENKYLIPPEVVPEIRKWVAPFVVRDPYGMGILPEYRIMTIQVDTPHLAFHEAKEIESINRCKLRVRTYNEIGSAPVFTEIKAKYRRTIVKTRSQIPFDKWSERLVMDAELPPDLQD